MIYSHKYLKQTIKSHLVRAHDYTWTLQGFGMLRLHLIDEYRLNVWDSSFRVPNVTLIHTHPWDFESVIVAGKLKNIIYEEDCLNNLYKTYSRAEIKPGIGGGIDKDTIAKVSLKSMSEIVHTEGQVYSQTANMIHLSNPVDGYITLKCRHRVGEDKALVYWDSEEFITAEPRIATQDEVEKIVSKSLDLWF
jgi:hypothetical protein